MTIIEAYAQQDNIDLWAFEEHFLTMTDSSNLSLLQFCLKYHVMKSKNNIVIQKTRKVVINFYPSYSCNLQDDTFVDYCKIRLMEYKPWKDDPCSIWGGTNATNEDI